jgi:hypothetical protein
MMCSAAASAQESRPGRGFVTAGLIALSDDSGSRTRFAIPPESSSTWFTEAAVFVVPRVAIGVERFPLGTVTSASDALCCILRDFERETALVATGRWRAVQHLLSLDAVGGVGVMFQHRDTFTAARFIANSQIDTITDTTNSILSFGVDAPIKAGPHVAIVPVLRLYSVSRPVVNTANVTATGSTRVAAAITAGISW